MKKISQRQLKEIASKGDAKVAFTPSREPREAPRNTANEDFGRALQGVEAAVKVIRASSELHFARADRIDSLVEKLAERIEKPGPVPYKIRVTKRDKSGNIVELNAIPSQAGKTT